MPRTLCHCHRWESWTIQICFPDDRQKGHPAENNGPDTHTNTQVQFAYWIVWLVDVCYLSCVYFTSCCYHFACINICASCNKKNDSFQTCAMTPLMMLCSQTVKELMLYGVPGSSSIPATSTLLPVDPPPGMAKHVLLCLAHCRQCRKGPRALAGRRGQGQREGRKSPEQPPNSQVRMHKPLVECDFIAALDTHGLANESSNIGLTILASSIGGSIQAHCTEL